MGAFYVFVSKDATVDVIKGDCKIYGYKIN
jgi:hypothetical protein